jgi:alpha-glucosidase
MQWDSSANAGFSTAKTTWLPAAPNYKERNVAAETTDPDSLLNYYKALLGLRKTNAALRDGDFTLVNESDKNVLAFVRTAGGKSVLVALNLTSKPQTASFDLPAGHQATTVLSSFSKAGQSNDLKGLVLPAFGAFVGQVSGLSR